MTESVSIFKLNSVFETATTVTESVSSSESVTDTRKLVLSDQQMRQKLRMHQNTDNITVQHKSKSLTI